MAKWSDKPHKTVERYRHVRTGGIYTVLHEGLEVTGDEGVPSIIYENENGDVFIQAKSRFFDGRFESVDEDEIDHSLYTHGLTTPGDVEHDL